MKSLARLTAAWVAKYCMPATDICENILGLIILTRQYRGIGGTTRYKTREKLWDSIVDKFEGQKIAYLEFGVHEGYSIKHIARRHKNPESRFVGFDSFEGLPEDWRNFVNVYPANHFDVGGKTPDTDDPRVSFEAGWFNDTLPPFLQSFELSDEENLIVHFDADLYSSTLYVLTQLHSVADEYTAIFDELPGEEARALYDYSKSFQAEVEPLGYTGPGAMFPMRVALKITTNRKV